MEVAVIGGGLTGLLAANLVRTGGGRAVVIEPRPVGGRARSDVLAGATVNRGPHALYPGGPLARALRRLGVPVQGAPPPLRTGRAFAGGATHALPSGAGSLVRTSLLGRRDRWSLGRAMATVATTRPGACTRLGAMTTDDWLDHLDLTVRARATLAMFVRTATYTDAFDVLSADVAAMQTRQVVRHGVRYLDGGWQRMIDALAAEVEVVSGEVLAVHGDGHDVHVELAGGAVVRAQTAVVAANSPTVAARLLGRAPWPVGEPAHLASLDLVHDATGEARVLFDVDEPRYFAPHGPPAALAPSGLMVSHAARYVRAGATDPTTCRADLTSFAATAGVPADAVRHSRYLHRATVVSALAVAAHGGLAGRPAHDDTGVSGVFVAGDWVGPVGHLGDACAASAVAAARAALMTCASRPSVAARG